MQRGIATGADDAITLGKLETPIAWFHETIDRALD